MPNEAVKEGQDWVAPSSEKYERIRSPCCRGSVEERANSVGRQSLAEEAALSFYQLMKPIDLPSLAMDGCSCQKATFSHNT